MNFDKIADFKDVMKKVPVCKPLKTVLSKLCDRKGNVYTALRYWCSESAN